MRLFKFSLALALLLAFSITFASALADVAYIYKSQANIEQPILDTFDDHGLSYELVSYKDLPLTPGQYRSVFIGDERFTESDLPLNFPTMIITRYHGLYFRIVDTDGISQLSSSEPLKVLFQGTNKKVYTQSKDSFGRSLAYYYLEKNNMAPSMVSIAKPYETGSGVDYGSVVAIASAGDELHLGRTLNHDLCYFGVTESKYWTPFVKELFSDCVSHVIVPLPSSSNDTENNETNQTEEPPTSEITCSSDSDCDDQNPQTLDSCTSPGLSSSTCENTAIINPLFSSFTSSSTLDSITVFFSLFDPSSATGLNIKINDNNWTSIDKNSTNYTFDNLTQGTEYSITLQILPSSETETLLVSTNSPVVDDSSSTSGGGGGGGGGSSNRGSGSGSSLCITEWSCTSWSECENGQQTRECSYPADYCEPKKDKPFESQNCVEELSLSTNTNEPNVINQEDSQPEDQAQNPTQSSSPITGAVIGAFQQQSTYLIIAFLLVVIALYVYVNSRNSAAATSSTAKTKGKKK